MTTNISDRWEYKILQINTRKWPGPGPPTHVNELFDKLGDEGWELVKIESLLGGGVFAFGFGTATSTDSILAFFKRPKK